MLSLCAAPLFGACTLNADVDHRGAGAPDFRPFGRTFGTAWVFSSGGPRGFVHVGVVKALDELGLVPDLIVGASVGAMVGVLRAAGLRGPQLEQLSMDLQPWRLASVAIGSEVRLDGSGLAQWVRELTGDRTLQALPTAVACVAQRKSSNEVAAFNFGDAGLAVQASSAIEGEFAPVRIRGDQYVDADLQMPLPVRLARSMGALRVLAVDASAYEDKAPAGTEAWRANDLRKRALTAPDASAADLLLHPDTGYYAGMSAQYRQRSIEIGYLAAMDAADRLRALHAG